MKKICIVSTCRSDFGIMSFLLKKIVREKRFRSYLIIYDIHESITLGKSIDEIIEEKIKINKIIRSSKKKFDNKETELSNKLGSVHQKISSVLSKIKPDLLLLYGDRIELMPFAISSLIHKIPIVHLNGGEITIGAYDELVRHSISKLASYHFVSSEKNKKILLQMGEEKEKIFNVGHLVYDNVKKIKFYNINELEKKLSVSLKKNRAILSFHPVTFMRDYGVKDLELILRCLEMHKNIQFFLSYPNNDVGNLKMIALLEKFTKRNAHFVLRKTFGHKIYLSLLKNCDFIIGNSSSGILEAPIFKKPTINIGNRQKGRLRTKSIIDCDNKSESINNCIKNVYKEKYNNVPLQYSKKNSINLIIKHIKKILKNPKIEKTFQMMIK